MEYYSSDIEYVNSSFKVKRNFPIILHPHPKNDDIFGLSG